MREALALIGEEGLEKLWEKHTRLHHELWAGLKEMGLEPFVEDPAERLVTVNCIKVVTSQSLAYSLFHVPIQQVSSKHTVLCVLDIRATRKYFQYNKTVMHAPMSTCVLCPLDFQLLSGA